jgi:hypothetical protein
MIIEKDLYPAAEHWLSLGYSFMLLLGYGGLVAPSQSASSVEMEVPCKL